MIPLPPKKNPVLPLAWSLITICGFWYTHDFVPPPPVLYQNHTHLPLPITSYLVPFALTARIITRSLLWVTGKRSGTYQHLRDWRDMPTLGRRQASDLRAFGARDAHSSLPDQPGRLNLELQAMNVLLRSGLIGFPHLVDWSLSSRPTSNGWLIGLPSRNAGRRFQSRPPFTPFPSSQTNYCWSRWFILSDRLPVLHAAGTGLVSILSWRNLSFLAHTHTTTSRVFPLSLLSLSLSFTLRFLLPLLFPS